MVQLNHLFSIIQFKDDSRFKGEFVYLSELLFFWGGILQYLHNILIPLCHYKAVFNTFTIIIVSGVYCLSLSKKILFCYRNWRISNFFFLLKRVNYPIGKWLVGKKSKKEKLNLCSRRGQIENYIFCWRRYQTHPTSFLQLFTHIIS